jgi:phosphonoacetaldehyde hydrolase
MWTVGLSASGNAVGLTAEEWLALTPAQQDSRRQPAASQLTAAGAHYVVDTIAQLPAVLALIDARMAKGERP